MGLCKCPKKKVTNLFCFEHRVNVCENCLVANHAKVNCWNCKSQTALNHVNYALQGRQDLIGISGTNCHVFVESFHARAITRFSSDICSMIITKGKSSIDSKVEANTVRNFAVDINPSNPIFAGTSLRKCVESWSHTFFDWWNHFATLFVAILLL